MTKFDLPDAELTAAVRAAVGEALDTTLDPAQDAQSLNILYERYDSLAVIDTVGAIEKTFGISIDLVDDDLRTTFASVAAIEKLVRTKRDDQALLAGGF